MIRNLFDAQMEVNKARSVTLEHLADQQKAGMIVESSAVEHAHVNPVVARVRHFKFGAAGDRPWQTGRSADRVRGPRSDIGLEGIEAWTGGKRWRRKQ